MKKCQCGCNQRYEQTLSYEAIRDQREAEVWNGPAVLFGYILAVSGVGFLMTVLAQCCNSA